MKPFQTAERVSSTAPSDNYLFQRSQLAYIYAAKQISGKVLEVGTGSGYGVEIIAPVAEEFWTIDKHYVSVDYSKYSNTRFIKLKVPPLRRVPSDYFDYVVCFQVIEHINDVDFFLSEIHRVLKPGGRLIVSTPNKKKSLTRNPWHIREYTYTEFYCLLTSHFCSVEAMGVFGDLEVEKYYEKNKKFVKQVLALDFLGVNKWLPRKILQIPYDIINRICRIVLLKKNKRLTLSIHHSNYYMDEASNLCYDLYYSAIKVNSLLDKREFDLRKQEGN